MKRLLACAVLVVAATSVTAPPAAAQDFEALGTRALGMGGAFTGVADDASAVYWNPAGLAAGAYFSLALDRNTNRSKPDNDPRAADTSGTLFALTMPALGLGYYRLRSTTLTPIPAAEVGPDRNFRADGTLRISTLVTHNAGVTLVQSVTGNVAVGATVRLVRGAAVSAVRTSGDHDALLDEGSDLKGDGRTRFDTDVGVIAVLGALRAGVTVRNLREPEFEADRGEQVKLRRRARAGISVRPAGVLLAADMDLTRNAGPFGDVRNFAAGAEVPIVARATVRGGLRVNTIADSFQGRQRVATLGATVAVTRSTFIDGQVSRGAATESRSWGIAGRVGF